MKLFIRSMVLNLKKNPWLLRRLAFMSAIPGSSFAYSTSDDALTNILTSAVNYAQSGPARALCVLAIAGAGYLWIGKGVLPKSYAIAIICGSGFIFGAGFIGANVLGLQG
ncbi:MAG: TrbC/VirB2 family protein [Gammaproteobacteria bacterium]|nr:TrbC/VirB2 family protein [Gammaproteobacteria bacterium]